MKFIWWAFILFFIIWGCIFVGCYVIMNNDKPVSMTEYLENNIQCGYTAYCPDGYEIIVLGTCIKYYKPTEIKTYNLTKLED